MKSIFVLLTVFATLFAAPALDKERTLIQSEGTTFKAKAYGDEYLHFFKTKNGDILVYNPKTKNYDYAEIKNDRLAPSGIAYKPQNTKSRKSVAKAKTPTITNEQLRKLYIKAKRRFHAR